MLALLLLACAPTTAAPPAEPPPLALEEGGASTEVVLTVDGPLRPLPGLCETSGAARDAEGRLWLVDDDQRDALFLWTPGSIPIRSGVSDRPWKDAEGLAVDDQGDLWLSGSHGRSRQSGKVGRRATLARFEGGPDWRLAFKTDALRPGQDAAELTPLLEAVHARCTGCAPLHGATGRVDGEALDIEALAWHRGHILLGLRAPLSGESALVFAVDPTHLQAGAPPSRAVTSAWTLPLGGRGIRDLTPSTDGGLLVLAGSPSGSDRLVPTLYRWVPGERPELIGSVPTPGPPPEAVVHDGPGAAWIFLDEGRRLASGLRPGGPHADAHGELECGANQPTNWARALRVTWSESP